MCPTLACVCVYVCVCVRVRVCVRVCADVSHPVNVLPKFPGYPPQLAVGPFMTQNTVYC